MNEDEEEEQIFNIKNRVNQIIQMTKSNDFSGAIKKKLFRHFKTLFVILVILLVIFFIFFIRKIINSGNESKKIINNNMNNNNANAINLNNNIDEQNKVQNNNNIIGDKINTNSNFTNHKIGNYGINRKLGIAFVYSSLFSNGIARFITLTSNYFVETGKYNVYLITGKPYSKEYQCNKKIKRFIGYNNLTIIENITRYYKIDFFILQNVLSKTSINWYKSLGCKIIGMFHGNYMSSMFLNDPLIYRHWNNFDLFDAYVFITADDYYFYNRLKFKNHIFIPNLYTFEPSKVESSNLTYNNIVMLGRQNDKIKGAIYAIKAMHLILKVIPDAKLYIITSDSRIQFLKNLTTELNLTNNINFIYHTYNISKYFLNSSILMYTSLSEAFPMVMNEGKAHGLPIVAFDVPISLPYQNGVITVDSLDYISLARESIKLFKDYNYRKKMGDLAKSSLSMFSNDKTVEMWGKLFSALIEGKEKFKNLQKEVKNQYYNETSAKKHIKQHFKDMKKYNSDFSCYTLENFTNAYYIRNIKTCKKKNKTKK